MEVTFAPKHGTTLPEPPEQTHIIKCAITTPILAASVFKCCETISTRPMKESEHNKQTSSEVRQVVELIAGHIDWISEQEGFATCPGEPSHTHRGGRRDCKVYLDRVPTITCFHSSCADAVKAKNAELRVALADPSKLRGSGLRRQSAEEKDRLTELQRKEGVRRRARNGREAVLRDFRWPVAEIVAGSPMAIPTDPTDHRNLHIGLFRPTDTVWIGDIFDSGKAQHVLNFRSRGEWLNSGNASGGFTCPAVFKEGSFARTNDNIVDRRFLVVESDTLTKDEVGAIFRWLNIQAGLRLRAIVDTGGKSLHGWFDYPGEAEISDLRLILPELDCDPKLFTPSQPVRLAGAFRSEKNAWQKLLFLDSKEDAR